MTERSKTYLITGASSGIGQAVARRLAECDCPTNLVLVARRKERLEELKRELEERDGVNVMVANADVTNYEGLKHALDLIFHPRISVRWQKLDGIIACSGCMHYMRFRDSDIEAMHREIDVNCKGLVNTVSLGLQLMNEGHVICISSDAGIKAFDGLSVYSGSKAFVEFFCDSLRREIAPKVKVTTIAPGDVKTELTTHNRDESALKEFGAGPEAEMLQAVDIAEAVHFALTRPDRVGLNRILIEPREAPL